VRPFVRPKGYMKALPIAVAILSLLLYGGAVRADHGQTMCTMQYQPVCGARQVQCIQAPCYPVYETFGNACVMSIEGGTFIHEGECTASETGPIRPDPTVYTPPAHCVAWFDGCNSCGRGEDGQSFCTLKACESMAPGYCTEYAKPTTSVENPDKPVSSDEPSLPTPSPVVETPEKPKGFFTGVWERILSFFNWF